MGSSIAKRTIAAAAAMVVTAGCGGPADRSGPPAAQAAECGQVSMARSDDGRQTRAMWIVSVGNGDWPSRPGLSAAKQQAEYRALLDLAVRRGFNTVYVQIRPSADAFYPSPYEPWSRYLTGKQGKAPGYDPLRFLVDEAHKRGLEFHAWFNPYRVSTGPNRKSLAPGNPARRHPDWVYRYGDALWYDPGLPQVRDLVTKVVLDVVRKYDIDGVHFDDYFYPYPLPGKDFPDKSTFKKYGAGFKSRADWRRHNVDTLVQTLSTGIHQAKPWVRFGISPFGVWRNRSDDPNGSATHALQSYDEIYADTRKWVRNGWIDYVVPQLYWPLGFGAADYRTLVAWWARQVAGTHVQLIIGQAAYQVGHGGPWNKAAELSRHLTLDAKYPQVTGEAIFSATDVRQDRRGFASRLAHDHFQRPALAPVSPRTAAARPAAPTGLVAEDRRLTWQGAGAASYAVYRSPAQGPACAAPDSRRLLLVVPGTTTRITDHTAESGRVYTYYVTALDRRHRESFPTRGAHMTAQGG
ncbi:glycoside hydrolase family 10 protein [Actinoallomurus soli]|uniref:glycoside hydrolase family 10 protein n=1 Tax=Actinoallomurus soli TaxID=2952535 RepID=UPI00209213A8|nr:family 10 glycosylhydrolase [Actinoallomurus soli]MCO5972588.1 family 10 glycosylhydrolase [Actinoallomurus soli]